MTNQINEATQLDIDQKIQAAADKYEKILKSAGAPLEVFLNLAFIYWESTDYGFNTAHGLPSDFIQRAGRRYIEVLNEARKRFTDNPEVEFWQKYFDYVTLGEESFIDHCRTLIDKGGVPDAVYIHLFSECPDPAYIPYLQRLLVESEKLPTTKNRYIASVIRSLLQLANRPPDQTA
jgi:hypothetical protein